MNTPLSWNHVASFLFHPALLLSFFRSVRLDMPKPERFPLWIGTRGQKWPKLSRTLCSDVSNAILRDKGKQSEIKTWCIAICARHCLWHIRTRAPKKQSLGENKIKKYEKKKRALCLHLLLCAMPLWGKNVTPSVLSFVCHITRKVAIRSRLPRPRRDLVHKKTLAKALTACKWRLLNFLPPSFLQ